MNWKASPPAIETATVAIAATSLGSAIAFAIMRIAPFGAGLAYAMVAGGIAALLGWMVIGRVDRRPALLSFVAATSLEDTGKDVLLLDERAVEADEDALLLNDPLPVLSEDMRVVRLFAANPVEPAAAMPPAGPAEMIARIEDFLGQPRGSVSAGAAPRDAGDAAPRNANDAASRDASAALHLALADIRRSLRQA